MVSLHPRVTSKPSAKRYSARYIQRVIAHSDERDRYERRILALEREVLRLRRERIEPVFRRGYRAGYCRQYGESIPHDWDSAEAAVRAAEHWAHQEAESWARTYLAKAYATPEAERTDTQRATITEHKRMQARERRLGGRA